jgi:hypothetical protein
MGRALVSRHLHHNRYPRQIMLDLTKAIIMRQCNGAESSSSIFGSPTGFGTTLALESVHTYHQLP